MKRAQGDDVPCILGGEDDIEVRLDAEGVLGADAERKARAAEAKRSHEPSARGQQQHGRTGGD